MQAITWEEAQRRAPAAFATAHENSARYSQVRTHELVERALGVGYAITTIQQDDPKRRNPLHVPHRVHLTPMEFLDTCQERPEIIILNSHNGRTRLQLLAGMYRLICANGLVVGTKLLEPVRVRHNSNPVSVAMTAFEAMMDHLLEYGRVIEAWKEIELTEGQRHAFAKTAAELRWGDAERAPVEAVLLPRRAVDAGNDLWRTFNVVQENTTKAGTSLVSATGRATRSRDLTSVVAGLDHNRRLWSAAAELAA